MKNLMKSCLRFLHTVATSAACLYGPGGGRNVHGADEYFELAHLPLVAGNLACLALHWCGVARER